MKYILTSVLLFTCAVLYGQNSGYPINVRNTVLGYQTTPEGIFYRGDTTPTFTPEKRYGTFMYVDTVLSKVYMYMNPTIKWKRLHPDSLSYNSATQILTLKGSNDIALVTYIDTTLKGYNTALNPLRVDTTVIATKHDLSTFSSALNGEVVGKLDSNRLSIVDRVVFDETYTAPDSIGKLQWNNTDGTLNLGLKGGSVTLQIGQEEVVRVVNKTNTNLLESEYKAVRVSSAQGQRLAVNFAQANAENTSASTLGIVTENINNNSEGFITVSGKVNNINTTGSLQGETWVDGDVLFLSPTVPGGITKIRPTAPNHTVIIGWVVYAHQNNGSIFVKIDNGYELDELHNVNITSPADKSLLRYDAADGVWKDTLISNIIQASDTTAMLNAYVKGSGTDNQMAYWNGTRSVTGSSSLTWEDNFLKLKYAASSSQLFDMGRISFNDNDFIRVKGVYSTGQTKIFFSKKLSDTETNWLTTDHLGNVLLGMVGKTTNITNTTYIGNTLEGVTTNTALEVIGGNGNNSNVTMSAIADYYNYNHGIILNATNAGAKNSNQLVIHPNGYIGIGRAAPAYTLDINATDAIRLPVGTEMQRPSISDKGVLRFNSTSNTLEHHDGTNWKTNITGGGVNNYIAFFNSANSITSNSSLSQSVTANKSFFKVNYSDTSIVQIKPSNWESNKSAMLIVGELEFGHVWGYNPYINSTYGLDLNLGGSGLFGFNVRKAGVSTLFVNVNDRKVGIKTVSPARELHVEGKVRITDLTTDTPTRIVGANTAGDLNEITIGTGLALTAGVLSSISTLKAENGIAIVNDTIVDPGIIDTMVTNLSNMTGIAYGNNVLVAVRQGNTSSIYYSYKSEMFKFTAVSGISNQPLKSIAFGRNVFVTVGTDNVGYRSTDGVNWDAVTIAPSSGTDYDWKFVKYVGNAFYAISDSTGTKSIATSTDGVTWSIAPITFNAIDIEYYNNLVIVSATNGNVYSTTNFATFNTIVTGTKTVSLQVFKDAIHGLTDLNGVFKLKIPPLSLIQHTGVTGVPRFISSNGTQFYKVMNVGATNSAYIYQLSPTFYWSPIKLLTSGSELLRPIFVDNAFMIANVNGVIAYTGSIHTVNDSRPVEFAVDLKIKDQADFSTTNTFTSGQTDLFLVPGSMDGYCIDEVILKAHDVSGPANSLNFKLFKIEDGESVSAASIQTDVTITGLNSVSLNLNLKIKKGQSWWMHPLETINTDLSNVFCTFIIKSHSCNN